MFNLPTAIIKTPATANGARLATAQNGKPRDSKGMAGLLFKTCRFYATYLGGSRVKTLQTARRAREKHGKL